MYKLYLQNVQRVWTTSGCMYSTTVCLRLDDLAVKVSQCWLDDPNSIPGTGDGNFCLHYQVHNICRVNRTSYTKVQLLFHRCGREETATHFHFCEGINVSMHIGLAILVLVLLSAQTCRPQRQRPICVGQSCQLYFHILFLVEPRMEQPSYRQHRAYVALCSQSGGCTFIPQQTNKHTQAMCSGILFKI